MPPPSSLEALRRWFNSGCYQARKKPELIQASERASTRTITHNREQRTILLSTRLQQLDIWTFWIKGRQRPNSLAKTELKSRNKGHQENANKQLLRIMKSSNIQTKLLWIKLLAKIPNYRTILKITWKKVVHFTFHCLTKPS